MIFVNIYKQILNFRKNPESRPGFDNSVPIIPIGPDNLDPGFPNFHTEFLSIIFSKKIGKKTGRSVFLEDIIQ
jgi:hypothetical protein